MLICGVDIQAIGGVNGKSNIGILGKWDICSYYLIFVYKYITIAFFLINQKI